MKYQLYTFVMLFTVLAFATCQTLTEASISIANSSRHIANVDRTLIGFTAIEIYVDAHFTLMQRANNQLIIQSEDDLRVAIQSEVYQGTLVISIDLTTLAESEFVGNRELVTHHDDRFYTHFNHYRKQELS